MSIIKILNITIYVYIINYELVKITKTQQSFFNFVFHHLRIFPSSLNCLAIIYLKTKKTPKIEMNLNQHKTSNGILPSNNVTWLPV